jgi:nucleotide-binding universal stress UspA family protein
MRILAATDGSAPANRAVELAARLTKELNGTLKVIHVCSERDVPEEQLSDYTISEHASSAEILGALSEAKLRAACEHAAKFGVSEIESASLLEIDAGAIAETIIDAAERNDADMIVMGKRGLSRLSGLIVGSVSQKVVSTATCAVIVVP